MRVIHRRDVERLVTPTIAITAMRRAFLALHLNKVSAPDEFVMHHKVSGDVHIKGAHIHGSNWMVAKVATAGFAQPGNHGCFLGINAGTGKVEVLVEDEGVLTEIRTAAAVAVSVDLLARTNAARLAIIGSGVQAEYQLQSVSNVRHFVDVVVTSRDPRHAERFSAEHGTRAVATVDEAVATADVVLCATTSRTPLITAQTALPTGLHITSSGADMVGKREIDAAVLNRAGMLSVDDPVLARRAGILQGSSTEARTTIGQLVAGAIGRTDNAQLTIAGLCGLGVQDAAIFGALLDLLA